MSVHFYCVRGHVTSFEKFHMSSPKMIFHVRSKLIHWLWFSRCLQKDEKFIDRQMYEQIDRLPFWIDHDHAIRNDHLNFQRKKVNNDGFKFEHFWSVIPTRPFSS